VERKFQHVIPNCYLKAWCDPRTPDGQCPFIWRISKDGQRRVKRAPGKSFRANDRYTIKIPGEPRNLIAEDVLGRIENDYVGVIERLKQEKVLDIRDRACLCAFAAVMHSRTTAMSDHWRSIWETIGNQAAALEKQHNSEPRTSVYASRFAENAAVAAVSGALQVALPMLIRMQMTVLFTDDEIGFITSDTPCVLFDPTSYRRAPGLRSPGLADRNVELTLPLTPRHLLVIFHHRAPFYQRATPEILEGVNRKTRFDCAKEFISWNGEIKDSWFSPSVLPEDAWENTKEGKEGLARRERFRAYADVREDESRRA